MNRFSVFLTSLSCIFGESNKLSVYDIVSEMDKNLNSNNRVLISEMIIHGRRKTRTIKSKSWSTGLKRHLRKIYLTLERRELKMLKN